jgi:hypothetical protein
VGVKKLYNGALHFLLPFFNCNAAKHNVPFELQRGHSGQGHSGQSHVLGLENDFDHFDLDHFDQKKSKI